MRGAYRITRIAGIDVKVHWTFLILLAWMFFSYYRETDQVVTALWGVGFVLLIFGCVVLHEFGHALAARRFGIATRDITMLPIGGIAQLEHMPERPKEELIVALAGPAVNVLIAAGLYVYLVASGQFVDMQEMANEGVALTPSLFARDLLAANVLLVVFNLIPAFPMDGGRVLRALLAMRWDRAKATRLAAGVGRMLAVAFVFFGFFYNFWLVFIGLFVYLGATAESRSVLTRSALEGYCVSDVVMTNYTPFYGHQKLQTAIDVLLSGQEKEFLVFDIDDMVIGILTREGIVRALANGSRDQRIQDISLAPPLELAMRMPLQEAFELMMEKKATVCPVYDGQVLAGMLNQENVQEFLLVRDQEAKDDEEDIYEGREEVVTVA